MSRYDIAKNSTSVPKVDYGLLYFQDVKYIEDALNGFRGRDGYAMHVIQIQAMKHDLRESVNQLDGFAVKQSRKNAIYDKLKILRNAVDDLKKRLG